jgi:triacylglycerol lipase
MAILLVHGIWNTGQQFARLQAELERAGIGPVRTVDLLPNSGAAPLSTLAHQVGDAARRLLEESGSQRIDVVGFSMGSLVCRCWIQRHGGRKLVRRFVSIAGPHRGTLSAYALSLAGVRDMRPGSALLADLEQPDDVWNEVELHCLWTPFDLMIMPGKSGVLSEARSVHRFPVLLHRHMIQDRRVIAAVIGILSRQGG